MTVASIILALVTLQRVGELLLARRNTTRLLAQGAVETAPAHYLTMIAVHASWLLGLWWFGWDMTVHWGWLFVFAVLQLLRVWVIVSLGSRWTTRIITLPARSLVRRGPYRYLSHPNYVVVVGEIAILPLAFGLPLFALVFSVLNALVLSVRIRAENRALAELLMSPDVDKPPMGIPGTAIGFAAMCVGMFMAILDVQVVATSLPTIQDALGIDVSAMSWVQTAYLIAEVIAIPLTGVLTRVLSMRWLFVSAVSIFTVASIGCASTSSFQGLILWRIVQGFSGGTLIPALFAAVFLLFPLSRQQLPTTLAGVLAVLAPTVGPIVGGWITETYSWHWLFLINLVPGALAALVGIRFLPRRRPNLAVAREIDVVALVLLGAALASLEIGLKQAPKDGWNSILVIALFSAAVAGLGLFAYRSLRSQRPLLNLTLLADRSFMLGCVLSFVLGIGLFGMLYLMPVFLALVRGYSSLEIGQVMLVTGVAQLITAPFAVYLERRVDGRILMLFGFALFAAGLGVSMYQTRLTDFDGMFWPQVMRGIAVMFCLLPPTRLALEHFRPAQIPDASSLFNLMRNLGGAIGLALIDSVIFGRVDGFGHDIVAKLQAHDVATASDIGIPLKLFANAGAGPLNESAKSFVEALVRKAALTQAINEAWALTFALTCLALVAAWFVRRQRTSMNDARLRSHRTGAVSES